MCAAAETPVVVQVGDGRCSSPRASRQGEIGTTVRPWKRARATDPRRGQVQKQHDEQKPRGIFDFSFPHSFSIRQTNLLGHLPGEGANQLQGIRLSLQPESTKTIHRSLSNQCCDEHVLSGTRFLSVGTSVQSIRKTQGPLCQNCARIQRFQSIRVIFERKADSPICWKR